MNSKNVGKTIGRKVIIPKDYSGDKKNVISDISHLWLRASILLSYFDLIL